MLEKIVSSKTRAYLLRKFIENPNKKFYLSQLRERGGWANLQRELKNLVEIGLIQTRTTKIRRFYKINQKSPFFPILKNLIETITHLHKKCK